MKLVTIQPQGALKCSSQWRKWSAWLHLFKSNGGSQILQEAQLMLTNPRDAFRGQSRSPSIVSFHMLGMVSY